MSVLDPMFHPVSTQFSNIGSISQRTSGFWRQTMKIPTQHNRIALVSCQIPKSFYLVESDMNTFYLGATMYTVAPGNYDVNSFVTYVNTLIAPSSIAYNRTNSKMTVTTAEPSITFSSRVCKLFGFEQGTTLIASSIESPHAVSFMRTSFIWFLCSLVHDFSFDENTFSNLLEPIFVNDIGSQQVLNWSNPSLDASGKLMNMYVPTNQQLAQFGQVGVNFYLLDDDSKQIDFHGIDVDFCLKTWFDPPIYPLLKNLGQLYFHQTQNAIQMDPENQN